MRISALVPSSGRWAPVLLLFLGGCGGSEPVTTPPSAPVPTEVRLLAGTPQTGLAGVVLPDSLGVLVLDQNGDPMRGVRVRWTLEGGGELGRVESLTGNGGRAFVAFAPGEGSSRVEAVVDGAAPVVFELEGVRATPGDVWMGRKGYVEYRPGTLPLVISVPHDGFRDASEIADRTWGGLGRDVGTQDLAWRLVDELEALTGGRPHLIVSHLPRLKLDPNREIVEAAQGDPLSEHAWREFQGFIEHARAEVAGTGDGLYMDLHGHGHEEQRLELGYLLGQSALSLRGNDFEANARVSSMATLGSAVSSFEDLIRGPQSLGGMFESRGVPAVPSPSQLDPGGLLFFNGGYNTLVWGSRDGGRIDGFQLEAHAAVRVGEEARAEFAKATAEVLVDFLRIWYGR